VNVATLRLWLPHRDRIDVTSNRYHSHQQYLSSNKNPLGYCPDHGTGVSGPIGVAKASGPFGRVKADG
jgi:hypothetical protein